MNVDSKYFSYCKEIGLMKENFTKKSALGHMISQVKAKKACDPAFIAKIEKLTPDSPEVLVRVAVLYNYDVNLTYVQHGNIKHGQVSGFASSKGSVRDGLKITTYKDKGEYSVVKDIKSVPYPIYNDKQLFSYEEIKEAMKGLLNSKVPAGTTSYESKDWSVSSYLVPILCVEIKHNGKTYWMLHNLHNGCFSFDWPNNPALLEKGHKAKKIGGLVKLGAFVLPILGLIGAVSGEFSLLGLLASIAGFIINLVISSKTKKSKSDYEKIFLNKPNASLTSAIKAPISMAVIGFIAMLIGFIAT